MKKVSRVFSFAQSGTVVAAVLAIVAGMQVAAIAYNPYGDGWIIGSQCDSEPDPASCENTHCAKFNNNGDSCGFAACKNGAIDWHNDHYQLDPTVAPRPRMACVRMD